MKDSWYLLVKDTKEEYPEQFARTFTRHAIECRNALQCRSKQRSAGKSVESKAPTPTLHKCCYKMLQRHDKNRIYFDILCKTAPSHLQN